MDEDLFGGFRRDPLVRGVRVVFVLVLVVFWAKGISQPLIGDTGEVAIARDRNFVEALLREIRNDCPESEQ